MAERRRSNRTMQQRLASDLFQVARGLARERERALRQNRKAAERQARAQARLAKEQEREEQLASAAEEHEENESLLADIRDLLKLAPARMRTRGDHEALRGRQPFPPPEREAGDRARLERDVSAALARLQLPKGTRLHALLPWLLAGLALIVVGVLVMRESLVVGGVIAAAGILLASSSGFLARGQIAKRDQELKSAEEARVRATVTQQIAADFERDRMRHETQEDERVARLEKTLAGDADACAASFVIAAEAIELPLEASAGMAMLSRDLADVPINLHAGSEIPLQRSTLLKTGRISYRNRPKKDVREDDARAIASLCLLYAAVAFDALPTLATVRVSAYRSGVDPTTGKEADLCYAAATFARAQFAELKLDRVDPIAALRSFDSRFACSATFVVKPVAPFAGTERHERDAEPEVAQAAAAADAVPVPGEFSRATPRPARADWLAALEIPATAMLDRQTIERAHNRLQDLYAEAKFERLAPDLQQRACAKRELIAHAAAELLREFPVAQSAPGPRLPGPVRRDNPDLDSIFG